MSNDKDNLKKHLYYKHESEKEFDVWKSRITILAGDRKCKRMLLKGELDDAETRRRNKRWRR